MTLRKMFTGVLCILILLISASCSNSKNVGLSQPDDQRNTTGVSVDSFEITRYNAAGFEDASLNQSIDAYIEQVGSETALVISVDEPDVDRTIALNIDFDGVNMHYERTEFHGLLGNDDDVLGASFGLTESVQLGQTAIRDYDPGSISGRFATVYFAPGASRTASAIPGDVYKSSTGVAVNRCGDNASFVADEETENEAWFTNGWMMADGDQNGQCTIADITPIGIYLNQSCETNPLATRADYDNNGQVTISELTPLGVHLNEGVASYRVGLRDDGDTGTTLSAEKTVDPSADAIAASGTPAVADLRTIFRHYNVASLFTPGEIAAANVNGTNGVEICVIPTNTNSANGTGTLAFVPWGGTVVGQDDEIVVTNFDIQMVGVGGGSGDDSNIFDSGISGGDVTANADVSFQVNAIEGTFNGLDFDATTLPEGMDAAHYANTLTAVRDNANWTFGTAGAAGFRSTSAWVTDGAGNDLGGVGDPGAGVVFPDYDPESDEFSPEGTLNVNLAAAASLATGTVASKNYKVVVLSERDYNWTVDVLRDPQQATFGPILKQGFDPQDEYALVIGTRSFFFTADWGDLGVPANFDSIEMEIWKVEGTGPGNCSRVNDFTFTEGTPGTGEFGIRENTENPGEYVFEYVVNGANLQGSSQYVVRWFNGVEWSSINMPENKTIPSGPAPAAADLTSIPNAGGYKGSSKVDFLQILYPNPKIRRWSDVFPNPETESVDVEKGLDNDGVQVDKTLAFNDILRTNGDEFAIFVTPIDSPQGFSIWPQVLIKNFTATGASDVTSADIPLATPSGPIYWSASGASAIIVAQHGLGRVVVDIAGLPTDDGEFGPINYGFGLFSPQGVDYLEVGEGTFTMSPVDGTVAPNAINWGIDAFDREERDLDNGDYSNHILNGSFVNDPVQPFVLWIEFNGGNVYDWEQNEEKVWKLNGSLDNIYVQVKDVDQPADVRIMEVGLRLVGVTPTGTFLAIHTITNRDFVKFGAPPSQTWGILAPGHKYEVSVNDRVLSPGGDSFGTGAADLLTVIGTNPNT